jgi:hypothetical protein
VVLTSQKPLEPLSFDLVRISPEAKEQDMDEHGLLVLWNTKRQHIITAQVAPALVLIAIMVLAVQGTFASANDGAKYLAVGVAAVTGFLAIVSQYAAIREAHALLEDLAKVTNASALTKVIASSRGFLSLTTIAIVGLGLAIFALVIWSVLG